MMIQRTLILLTLIVFLLGATPVTEAKRLAVLPPDAVVVNDTLVRPTRENYLTLADALASGSPNIRVMAGVYPESVTVGHTTAITCDEGATLINDGESVTLRIIAPHVTITGCTIQGNHDGIQPLGDFYHGTAVLVESDHATLKNVTVINPRSFAFLMPTLAAHHTTIEGCDLRNVATSPMPQLLAGTAVQFINGSQHNVVRDCEVRGFSGGLHVWYGSGFTDLHNNLLENNFGWIPQGFVRATVDSNKDNLIDSIEWGSALRMGRGGFAPRSAMEFYGVPGAAVESVRARDNRVYGNNGSGAELADVLVNVDLTGNEMRDVGAGFWMGGTGSNRATGTLIADNRFYGRGGGDDVSNWFSGTGAISRNIFENYCNSNIGTIHIPGDALGDADILYNEFRGGCMVSRISTQTGTVRLIGNRITDPAQNSVGIIYAADTLNPNILLQGNRLEGGYGRVINTNWDTPLTLRDNYIEGEVYAGGNSIIEGNTLIAPAGMWTPLHINDSDRVTGNTIRTDNTLFVMHGTNALMERNYFTRLDGSAFPVPACPTGNTCTGNWTTGQVPPP